jgi:hypothetical protein
MSYYQTQIWMQTIYAASGIFMRNFCKKRNRRVRELLLRRVIAGLDPAIHLLRKTLVKMDGYAGQARV